MATRIPKIPTKSSLLSVSLESVDDVLDFPEKRLHGIKKQEKKQRKEMRCDLSVRNHQRWSSTR